MDVSFAAVNAIGDWAWQSTPDGIPTGRAWAPAKGRARALPPIVHRPPRGLEAGTACRGGEGAAGPPAA